MLCSMPVSFGSSCFEKVKQEVSLKKIIVEGYRTVGSFNTKMTAFSLQMFCCCCLLISVDGEAYVSDQNAD